LIILVIYYNRLIGAAILLCSDDYEEGPLATLRRCVEERLKIKVWTRNYRYVRGICVGYVVAFDKHWNLVGLCLFWLWLTCWCSETSWLQWSDVYNQAPRYLTDHCTPVSDTVFRQRLRSASSHQVSIPRYRLSTYGRRAFSVAGTTVWNSLPEDMRDPECSVDSYRQSLKTFLFSQY